MAKWPKPTQSSSSASIFDPLLHFRLARECRLKFKWARARACNKEQLGNPQTRAIGIIIYETKSRRWKTRIRVLHRLARALKRLRFGDRTNLHSCYVCPLEKCRDPLSISGEKQWSVSPHVASVYCGGQADFIITWREPIMYLKIECECV